VLVTCFKAAENSRVGLYETTLKKAKQQQNSEQAEEDYYFSDSVFNNYFLSPLLIYLTLSPWGKRISFRFER